MGMWPRVEVLSALDAEPDGYAGVYGDPPRAFRIVRSYVSDAELCRVVVLSADEGSETPTTQVESFCKAKGGKWR